VPSLSSRGSIVLSIVYQIAFVMLHYILIRRLIFNADIDKNIGNVTIYLTIYLSELKITNTCAARSLVRPNHGRPPSKHIAIVRKRICPSPSKVFPLRTKQT
jgi:hypothetical protein